MSNIDEDLKISPRPDNVKFTYYWDIFIEDIIHRDTIKKTHREQLTVLCQLHTEFDYLTRLILEEGYTYVVESRNGSQQKVSSNVLIRDKIISELRQYARLLNIVISKDTKTKKEEDHSEWD
jgi:hypothetical protein